MKADKEKIEWLLENATQYEIWKATGVTQSNLSDMKNGRRKIENLTFRNASKLTDFAEELMDER